MAWCLVALLLAAAVAAYVLLAAPLARAEVDAFSAAGEPSCSYVPSSGECEYSLTEDPVSIALDARCRLLTSHMGAEGLYNLSFNHIIDNGRLVTSEGAEGSCSLLMTDDLVQGTNSQCKSSPKCHKGNTNLYKSDFLNLVNDIRFNEETGKCDIVFEESVEDDKLFQDYASFLRINAAAALTNNLKNAASC